jgi:hypothetical protein
MRLKVIGTAAVLTALGAVYATVSPAKTTVWTEERFYTAETWSTFADIGSRGAGPGDIFVAQQSLKDGDGRSVGAVNGFGVNLHRPFVFFHWTATLAAGSVTVERAVNLQSSTTTYPIAGGTGRYRGVRGTVTVSDAGKKGSLAILRYER